VAPEGVEGYTEFKADGTWKVVGKSWGPGCLEKKGHWTPVPGPWRELVIEFFEPSIYDDLNIPSWIMFERLNQNCFRVNTRRDGLDKRQVDWKGNILWMPEPFGEGVLYRLKD
jgi:hypothetical protein